MKQFHFLIDEAMLEHLQALGGSVTAHIRQALWEYLRRVQKEGVASSLSKKGDTYVQSNSETETR